MKRLITIGMILIMLFSCQGGGGSSSIVSSESIESVESSSEKITYTNPVFDFDFADPSIIRADDGYFYAYATGGKIIKSADLINWERLDDALSKKPTWGTPGANLWAPHITKINDEYILYYSLSKWEDPNPGIGYATSLTPYGPFNDHGKMFNSEEIGVNNSIDPFVFIEDDKVYMIWGSFRGIYLTELTSDGKSVKDFNDKTLLAGFETERPLDVFTYEAAYLIKTDDYYYLFLSNGLCCTGDKTYNVRVARSKNIKGPYLDHLGRNMFNQDRGSLVVGRSGFFIAPGHNSVILDDNGDYWLVYHAYHKDVSNKRVLLIDKLEWDNGWPQVKNRMPSNTKKDAPFIKNILD